MAFTCCTACPLVSIVPAVTLSEANAFLQLHGSNVVQPQPMLLMQPMTAPMPQFYTDSSDARQFFGELRSGLTTDGKEAEAQAWSWSGHDQWAGKHFGDGLMWPSVGGHESQYPIDALAMNSKCVVASPWQSAYHNGELGETLAAEAPSQFHMDEHTLLISERDQDLPTLRRRSRAPALGSDEHETESVPPDAIHAAPEGRENAMARALLMQLSEGGAAEEAAIESFKRMSFSGKDSSRAAQLALQQASANDAVALASGLRGHVHSAVQCKYANYVVQKIMEVMPVKRTAFIVEELVGVGVDVARHHYACRVVCRIIEHESLENGPGAELVAEILANAEELCNHGFGNFVIRHILEYGLPAHRHHLANVLSANLVAHAKDSYGSHVVEAALRFCDLDDQRAIVQKLVARKDQLYAIATHKFGRHVAKALVASTHRELQAVAVTSFKEMSGQLQGTRYGKSVVQSLKACQPK